MPERSGASESWRRRGMPRRLATLLGLIVVAYVLFVANEYRIGYADAARGRMPLYTDFTSLYAAALQLRDDSAENLYRPRRAYVYQIEAATAVYGAELTPAQARGVGYSPWMYPPIFMFFALPLAFFPYLPALLLWLALTAVPYVLTVRRSLGVGGGLFALAAPPAFFNVAYGQTGFLSAGLIGGGLGLLGTRPVLAGVCIGFATFKPHLGVLVPLALICGGHWRSFGAATVTVLGLVAASAAVFGIDAWYGFIGTVLFNVEGFAAGAYTWNSMTSVLSAAYGAGMSLDVAWRCQFAVALVIAAIVAHVWWVGRRTPQWLELQSAVLCLGTPLVVPMIYLYDLAIMVPAVAWIGSDYRRHGAAPWQYALLIGSTVATLGVFLIAARIGVQIAPVLLAVLFALAVQRFRVALIRPGRVDATQPAEAAG